MPPPVPARPAAAERLTIHVVPAIARESSGPSYAVMRLCETVIAAGEEVVLATCDADPLPAPPPFVRRFPPGLGPRLTRAPALNRWLHAQVRSGGTGIIHSHGLWRMSAVYAARAARGGRAQLVVSPHGTLSRWAMRHGRRQAKRLFWVTLQRRALERAACFRATSELEYEDLRRLGFRQPVALIPNGIDVPRRRPAEPPGEDRTLLFLGRLHPVKGLDALIDAWCMVQDEFPHWRLVIAGDDTDYQGTSGYMAELRRRAAARGAARLSFAGEITGAAKWDAYRDAGIYVLPSRSENFGVTVAEALAAGTPVVATDQTPWRGLPARGAGWCIEVGAAPLAACLREALATDGETLRRMGMRGRRWMEAEFDWADIGRRMAATYRWLRGESRERPAWVRAD